ncbi:MAG: efflux RND transporter permease subunit [Phycisphaeraceae bacterium]|nr:efflux RND transporter permease subunit [Phycisphaeraceae bacterium]
MSISAPFIRRPVATTLLMLSIIVAGWMAYRALPVSDLPNVDFPTITVSANLPGASPETVAAAIAVPLEREFSTIAGIDSMTSASIQGSTTITITFALSRNIDDAAQDVAAAIARTQGRLPTDMPQPPSYRKANPADQPIMFLAVTSPTLPLYQLNEYADTVLAPRIGTMNGVAQVVIFGPQKYAVRIQFDPLSLAAKGVGLDQLARAIRERNVKLPTGVISGPETAPTVESTGQLVNAEAYREAVVAWRNGNAVRLKEIATVVDGVENDRTAAWFLGPGVDRQRSIVLAIQRQPGANTVAVAQSIRRLLSELEPPGSIRVNIMADRSLPILASVEEVKFTLWLTLGLVTGTIFIFLRAIRALLIPVLAMPLSIIGTFGVMWLLGFSLDNLSLMALVLCVGFVVDDAIVVLENIVRHMEMGKSPLQAAFDGSAEIGFTVVSMTISLVAVFIPVLFMGGLVGRLLSEFSVTIATAILISGVVSLTLTPMLCSRWLRRDTVLHGTNHAVSRMLEGGIGFSHRAYLWLLDLALRSRAAVVLGSVGVLAVTAWMAVIVPKGFMPNEDQGRILVQTEAAEGISHVAMAPLHLQVMDAVAKHPEVEAISASIGARGGTSTSNVGFMMVRLRDRPPRTKTADEVLQELRGPLGDVPGMRATAQVPPTIRIGGRFTRALYQFTLQSTDTEALFEASTRLYEALVKEPDLRDVVTDLQLSNPQIRVDIDRDRAAALGVTPEQIELALATAFSTRQISTIYAPNDTYQVIAEVSPDFQTDASWLSLLHVSSATGDLVPLDAVVDISEALGPLSVNHSAQLPSVTISFNLAPGVSLGEAVRLIEARALEVVPAEVSTEFQGTAQAFQESFAGLGWLLLLAILVTYVVLGILYESFFHPLTILTALPFAGCGALAALLLTGTELNLYSFVGIILLVGLVKKNGIMMVDFAIERRRHGASAVEAIREACAVRYRPIMMTTLSALLGVLPLALWTGAGAEVRRPLGIAVVGGLLFSQTVTLLATPVLYLYVERLANWFGRRVRDPEGSAEATPPETRPGLMAVMSREASTGTLVPRQPHS